MPRSRRRARASRFVLPVLVVALAAPGAAGGPLTQDACGGTVEISEISNRPGMVLENLLFAEGDLWVTNSSTSTLERTRPDGEIVDTVSGIGGGLAQDPTTGEVYAGAGNGIVAAALETGEAAVVRFDPGAADLDGSVEIISQGFSMANGMALDVERGRLYVSNDVAEGLVTIDLDSTAGPTGNWTELTEIYGTNGLVISPDGSTLHAAITFDQRSPIAAVPLDEPDDWTIAVQTTFGVVDLSPAVHADGDPDRPLVGVKGLDDMTRDGDGILYPVANGTGELLRVDPATGDACLITGGLQNPSSVRIAAESGDFADNDPATIDFTVTEFSGRLLAVRWAPAA